MARRLELTPAIVFLVVGIVLAFTPGFPPIEMKPEGVLLLVLPPLIYSAAGTFVAIVIGEVLFGIAVGWLSLRLRQWAHDPRIEITLSLLTPYLAFWVPEHLGGSGVLATVVAGLNVSWNGPLLISSATRLQGIFFWDFATWLIEGVLFLIVGFDTHALVAASKSLPVSNILSAIAITTVIVIVARFLSEYPGAYLPRLVS